MNRNRFRTATVAAAVFIILVAAGCGKKGEPGAALKTRAEAVKARAEALYADGDYGGAAALYDKILVDYPTWAANQNVAAAWKQARTKALFVSAREAMRSGRYEEAEEAFRKALALAPGDAEINYGVGWVYVELALQYKTKAQMSRGTARVDYAILADAHADLARERFERSIKLGPEHWAGYRGMANYYIYRGENDKALEALANAEKYSQSAEDKIAVARLRLRAFAAEKNFDEAKETLDALVEKYPENGEVYFALGEYFLLLDEPDLDEARRAFKAGITKKFEDEGTRNQMHIMLSRLLMRKGEYDDAMSTIKAALATDPFNNVFMDEYAVAWGTKKLSEKKR